MSGSTAIIVFARAPQAGLVKTRLVPALGEQGALTLYRAMLRHALSTAQQCAPDELILSHTPHGPDSELRAMARAANATLRVQCGADLGARMHHALRSALRTHEVALLLGSDCPSLRRTDLDDARDRLLEAAIKGAGPTNRQRADLVFIPATDGGYVLVGASRPCEEIFQGLPWGGSEVMKMTRQRMRAAQRKWQELPAHSDIDRPEDLALLPPGFLDKDPGAPKF